MFSYYIVNIPGIYCQRRVASIREDITYLDTPYVDHLNYTLLEITYFGFLRYRICRCLSSRNYFQREPFVKREIFLRIIRPWLLKNDEPLGKYLSQHPI